MPIQTFALSSGKVPAAKPMHTGTLGKTSRGGVNRSYFRDTPSGSSGGLVSLPDGVLLLRIRAASARANGWSGRGEKRRLSKACEASENGPALRQALAQKKKGGRRTPFEFRRGGHGLRRERPTYH